MKSILGSEFMEAVQKSFRNNGKILICGNGGLAAESEHFAAEMMGKFGFDFPVPCIAITCNSSLITAIANDFGFENVFAHQVKALGKAGDVFIGMTTSKSKNILKALEVASEKGLITCAICGRAGDIKADYVFNLRYDETAAIQNEALSLLHYLAYNIKRELNKCLIS